MKNKYCETCIHRHENNICHKCIDSGYNANSDKPIYYQFDWEDRNENSRNSVK